MGQDEIIEWLYQERNNGEDKFFSNAEIFKGVGGHIHSVHKQTLRLANWGILELKICFKPFCKQYRLDEEFIRKRKKSMSKCEA